MNLEPGTMVNANVRLVELLGKGGMGSVWLADHLMLEARVAVKFIAPELVGLDPSLKERFKNEASICARLRSIHVAQTFDLGVMDDGSPYMVMELLEGTNLTDRIENGGPMAVQEVGVLVQQIAKVLHRAHVLGIVHRDIKPDNIFLTSDSDYDMFVKLLDFGIAKQSRVGKKNVTKTGAVVGTPEFMSPEQAIGSKDLDHRADLFSLGVVAFYALTGDLPFDFESGRPLWLQVSEGGHIPATRLRPDLFDEIDDWFDRALQAKPDHRYQSARDMANALSRMISDNTSQIMDELSTSLDDSLNLPKGEAMNLRERLLEHIRGHVDVDEDAVPTPPGEPPVDQAVRTARVPIPPVDVDEPVKTPRLGEDSAPGMYDLFDGPDSEEFAAATVWMNDQDHREAEMDAEGPPTQRRPQPQRQPTSSGVYAAVRSGAYNAGWEGAYNQVVPAAAAVIEPIPVTVNDPAPMAMRGADQPPWVEPHEGGTRWALWIGLILAAALVAGVAIYVLR